MTTLLLILLATGLLVSLIFTVRLVAADGSWSGFWVENGGRMAGWLADVLAALFKR